MVTTKIQAELAHTQLVRVLAVYPSATERDEPVIPLWGKWWQPRVVYMKVTTPCYHFDGDEDEDGIRLMALTVAE